MSAGSGSPIVVRALEAAQHSAKLRLNSAATESQAADARRIAATAELLTARKMYDEITAELVKARMAVKLSGDFSLTDNGESAPAGRCAP